VPVPSGFGGAGVLEVVEDFHGDTFRAVYTLKFADAVYVLHAFEKKSTSGRETPRRDVELVKRRLREAEQIAKGRKP
jgi:phage-related protein